MKSTFKNGFPTYTHKGKEYTLPYWLPERSRYKYSITVEFVPAGTSLPIVGMRNALFMGLKPAKLTVSRPLGIHYLKHKDDGTWMTSMPQEIEQHTRQLAAMRGKVLVGGLGLGLAASILQQNKNVTDILVVEKSYEILELVAQKIPKQKTHFYRANLYDFLKETREKFDYAFYDIWQPTGQSVLEQHTLPLRRLSEGIVEQSKIECWNEDEMIGQILVGARSFIEFMGSGDPWTTQILNMPEDKWKTYREPQGLIWHFYDYLRNTSDTKQQAHTALEDFCAALKDPKQLDTHWI